MAACHIQRQLQHCTNQSINRQNNPALLWAGTIIHSSSPASFSDASSNLTTHSSLVNLPTLQGQCVDSAADRLARAKEYGRKALPQPPPTAPREDHWPHQSGRHLGGQEKTYSILRFTSSCSFCPVFANSELANMLSRTCEAAGHSGRCGFQACQLLQQPEMPSCVSQPLMIWQFKFIFFLILFNMFYLNVCHLCVWAFAVIIH